MNLQEQINRIQEMMGVEKPILNDDGEKYYIDWDENYGITFKIVKTPEGRQSVGEWNPNLISVVTPENESAWTDWEEVSEDILNNWKDNWDNIQKSLGTHKYNQIIRSIELYKKQNEKDKDAKFLTCKNCRKKFTQTTHKNKKSLPICPWCGTHNK